MQLTLKEKKYVIVFIDGSTKNIKKQEFDLILKESSNKDITGALIQGNYIKFTTIGKLLTEEEFYEQYPDKRSDVINPHRILWDMKPKPYNRIKTLTGMIKGLQEYIDSGQYKGTDKPLELMKKMKLRLTEAKTDDTISPKEITQIYSN